MFAYPTVSGNLHVGHFISYTLPDVIARHKRLMGFNVKFPLGFHATGVDCLKILNESQENLEKACKKYSLEPEAAKQFKTPRDVDKYLEKEIIKSFQMAGLSLDYRTITSTIDPHYNRFIQWQFKKLKEKGCLTQGDYLLPYCPSCKHNVSIDDAEMDISEGAGASVMEYTIIKFRLEDNTFLVAATLRPETIYGLSNMWVRQDVEYVVSEVNEEKWIISKECARKLEDQGKKAKIIGTIKGEELVGKYVESLGTIGKIVILPSKFVDPDVGTGIVMSVPSDAPFDYIALEDIKKDIGLLKKYSIEQDVANVKPISIIKSKGFGDFPAKEIIEKLGIKNQEDPKLEEATQEVYNIGFHTGVMAENCKPYGGMNVLDAKDKVRADLIKNNQADLFSDLSNRVVCRCKTQIILKLLKDQWFLNYSNPEWKKQAKECISQMQTWPPEYKDELPGIIDWLKARPCVRNRGLGTRFPFDESWIIEPLADSTIYMAFYFVSQEFNQKNLTLDDLTDEFFDYVFLGKGKAPSEIAEKIRHNFLYYYPLDINAGGKEHKKVHFPFFIFNHTAVFEKEHWPKGIFLNWHVIVEGEKMSKSKGNSVFWQDAIKKYRADACRLYAVVGSEMWSDFDWRETEAKAFSNHVSNFYNTCEIVFKSNSIANSCLQNVALPSNSIANSCLQNVALPSNSIA
ncbi:MAG: leucine--tRNA ligase, partial [Euryarchaeota archaeon HGW-Euryarchaeota-1]